MKKCDQPTKCTCFPWLSNFWKPLFDPAIICQVYQPVTHSFAYQDCRRADLKKTNMHQNSWRPGLRPLTPLGRSSRALTWWLGGLAAPPQEPPPLVELYTGLELVLPTQCWFRYDDSETDRLTDTVQCLVDRNGRIITLSNAIGPQIHFTDWLADLLTVAHLHNRTLSGKTYFDLSSKYVNTECIDLQYDLQQTAVNTDVSALVDKPRDVCYI